MIGVIEAQAIIRQHIRLLPTETIPFTQARRRFLRQDILATENMPNFDRSAMDGYVIRADDPASTFTVIGEIKAGDHTLLTLAPGQALRIFTGAKLPEQPQLRVVMQEQTQQQGHTVSIRQTDPELHIRFAGEDAKVGDILLHSGTALNAASCALLAAFGIRQVTVSSLPKIFHLTTGDEIMDPLLTPESGKIRNSNAVLIRALLQELHLPHLTHHHCGDHLEQLLQTIKQINLAEYDMILISGGSGQGSYDLTHHLFQHLNCVMHFEKISMRPGKPCMFGTNGSQLLFGLPGNPLSHFVCFQLFIRYALELMQGGPTRNFFKVRLAHALQDIKNPRETWWPAILHAEKSRLCALPLKWKSSGSITSLPPANGLIQIPAATDTLAVGSELSAMLTGELNSL